MMTLLRSSVLAMLVAATGVESFASATDIYITPNGNATGICATAPRDPSWFNNPANWGSGAALIGPGTTVHLCGTFVGTAGQQLLYGRGSGTSGNPITIKFEAGTILTAPYWSSASGAISLDNLAYIVLDGGINGTIQNSANGTTLTYQVGTTAISAHPCSNCEIKNLTIANLYIHQKCLAASGCDGITSHGTKAIYWSGSNVLFHDLIIHDVDIPFYQSQLSPGDNVQMYNNNIYNFNMNVFGGDQSMGTILIYNNHFHDMDVWDTGVANYYHHEAIHVWSNTGVPIQNLYIYNNLFDGNEGDCCVSAWIYIEGTSILGTAYIFNNVIVGSIATAGQIQVSSGANHLVYNNTIISPGVCVAFNSSVQNISVANNAFDGCATYITTGYDNGSPPTYLMIDYNNYGFAGATGNHHWQFSTNSGDTLSGWQQACSCDSHSQSSLTSHLAISSIGVPQASYSGIGAGANLTGSAVGLLTSLMFDTGAGNTRTPVRRRSVGTWDAGAYAPPFPPTAITATGH